MTDAAAPEAPSPEALQAGADTARAACVLTAHDDSAVLRLQGDEVRRWTNGMFTNNTRRLQVGQGNRHAWCDDRGRVQGVLALFLMAADTVLLVLEGVSAEAFAARFQMYLMLDDIELEDLREPEEGSPQQLLRLTGPTTSAVLAAAGLAVPEGAYAHARTDGVWLARRPRAGLDGAELLVDAAALPALRDRLEAAGATSVSPAVLDALRIVAGQARWPVDGTEKSLVHELRLNEDCVAFDKGCYVGQEVINRIDVRGGVQKRLVQVRLEAPVPAGTSVALGGKTLGTLTSQVELDGKVVALGVLRKAAWEPGTELSLSSGGTAHVMG